MSASPALRFRRLGVGRYRVERDGVVLGEVRHSWHLSHIRRGRMQTDPWWQAVMTDGTPVERDRRDVWMSRHEAAEVLAAACPVIEPDSEQTEAAEAGDETASDQARNDDVPGLAKSAGATEMSS